MWQPAHSLVCLWLLCLAHFGHSITVTERASTEPTNSAQQHTNSTANAYRVSVPKTKQHSNRVPAHLQGVRSTGYVYDDADDVIHIIEPPQHFQQLKRMINQQGMAAVWAQQGKVRIMRPEAQTAIKAPLAVKMPMKVKEQQLQLQLQQQKQQQRHQPLAATKVDRPAMQQPHSALRAKPVSKAAVEGDLQPQETQMQRLQELHVPPPALPLEILASVRKTERLLQQQQQPSQHFYPKQRHKSQQTHTVIMEKAYEQEKFQRGKERRVSGQKWRKTRARRDANFASYVGAAASQAQHNLVTKVLKDAQLDVERGRKLLLRLNELLQNADAYLALEQKAANATANSKVQRDRVANGTAANAASKKAEADLQKILENSLNATALIVQQIQHKHNETTALSEATLLNANTKKRQQRRETTTLQEQSSASTTEPNSLVNAKLLYDDVMTNIRNMLQAHNLQLLEEQHAAGVNGVSGELNASIVYLDAIAPTEVQELGELQQLQRYLHELQQLVVYLPTAGLPQQNAELSLNTHEFMGSQRNNVSENGAQVKSATNWFLINGEGKIFQTRLHEQLKPSASIFHRFPDIPVANEEQVKNETLLALDVL